MAQNNIKDILEQQKTLADQMRRHQQQAAQDAYAQGQRSLSQQLDNKDGQCKRIEKI